MRITDRKFLKCYFNWGSNVNWYASEVFLSALHRTKGLETKKALFLKIFFEYVQACEHLLAMVHATKEAPTVRGLKRRIVDCPSGGSSFKYLWKYVRRFRNDPFKLYGYLGIRISRAQYLADQKAFDGFFWALFACLKNRYGDTRGGRGSRVMKAFNKIKHGFPVFTANGSDTIYFLIGSGRRLKSIPFRLNENFAREMCGSAEAIRNSMANIAAFLLK